MHIHKPKPPHGLREFLSEISVIVVGVLIALGLEQTVESLHWRHKVHQAEVRLRADLEFDITFAAQFAVLEPCAEAYLDRMQTDLVKHDSAEIERLYEFGPPFIRGAWKSVAWESAVASQIGDHMDNDRFQAYSEAFRGANLLRDFQDRLRDDNASAVTGRFALPPDAKTVADQLAAVERVRLTILDGRAISANDLINPGKARFGITPDPQFVEKLREKAAACLSVLSQPQK
jgi:hypothetical protein